MFSDLNVFKIASALVQHSSVRQNAISQNISNSDTPGYKAQDVPEFATTYKKYGVGFQPRILTLDSQSIVGRRYNVALDTQEVPGTMKPNGNSVSVETEMMKAAEVAHNHNMALTVYKYGLDVMRMSLGRGR